MDSLIIFGNVIFTLINSIFKLWLKINMCEKVFVMCF